MKHLFFVLASLLVTPAWSQAIVLSTCGSANYSAAIGQLHQLTMDPAWPFVCAADDNPDQGWRRGSHRETC